MKILNLIGRIFKWIWNTFFSIISFTLLAIAVISMIPGAILWFLSMTLKNPHTLVDVTNRVINELTKK